MKTYLCGLLLCSCLIACGAPGRPSGLPDPEYEQPQATPWPPASAAAVKGGAPATEPEPEPVGAKPAPEGPAGPPQGTSGSGATLPPGIP